MLAMPLGTSFIKAVHLSVPTASHWPAGRPAGPTDWLRLNGLLNHGGENAIKSRLLRYTYRKIKFVVGARVSISGRFVFESSEKA